MKTLIQVDTWLPVFSGFYGTIWEPEADEESEIENINNQRIAKGLRPIVYDEIEWDYADYTYTVSKRITTFIGTYLKSHKFIKHYAFQELKSPREYNFANDSINVSLTINSKEIERYLETNKESFCRYVKERYTSRDGFISYHSNDGYEWLEELEECLANSHKAGAILNFVLLNEDKDFEMTAYEYIKCNGAYLTAKNYTSLLEVK
jgi:hypothetical protein